MRPIPLRHVKVGLAVLGFLLSAVSIALDNRMLGWVAIGVLCAALALRVWLQRKG